MKDNEWIFTSEQMPGLDEEAHSDYVLVTVKGWNDYTHVEIAYFNKYGLSSDGRYMDTPCWIEPFGGKRHAVNDIVAWMPLPTPACGKMVSSEKTKKGITLTPIIGLRSWKCRYCYSRINEGQKVCNSCGCGVRWS